MYTKNQIHNQYTRYVDRSVTINNATVTLEEDSSGIPRAEVTVDDNLLNLKFHNLKGEAGPTDYDKITNKPKINNVELGDNTPLIDLGILPKLTDLQLANLNADHSKYLTEHLSLSGYVKTTDYRLTNERTPVAHTHNISDVIDLSSKLNDKQDLISDLATIRSGAAKGATAIQLHLSLADYVKTTDSRLSDARTPLSHTHALNDIDDLRILLNSKLDLLTSGNTIKTVNGESLLGKGDISITCDISDIKVDGTSVVTNKIANIDLSNKVDKVSGKGLSTNDYTDDDKAKLDAIGSWAESTTKPAYTASEIDDEGRNVHYVLSEKLYSTSVAQKFVNGGFYSVGDYVTYKGELYRCKIDIDEGTWNVDDWDKVKVMECKADKSDLDSKQDKLEYYSEDAYGFSIKKGNSGIDSSNGNDVILSGAETATIQDGTNGESITIAPDGIHITTKESTKADYNGKEIATTADLDDKADKTDLGTLTSLNTSTQSDLVSAINELVANQYRVTIL